VKRGPARPILLLLLIGATLPFVAHSKERPAEAADTIRAVIEQGQKAVQDQDLATLERLWSEHLHVNNPQNQVSASRRDVLELVKRGLIRYSKYEQKIEVIRQYGAVVILTSRQTIPSLLGSTPFSSARDERSRLICT
jgi:Domain of unknown function (DUF4440)